MKPYKSEYLEENGGKIEEFCNRTGQRHLVWELYKECRKERDISLHCIYNLLGDNWSRASIYNKMNHGTNVSLIDFGQRSQDRVTRITSVINLIRTLPEGTILKGRKGAKELIEHGKSLKASS